MTITLEARDRETLERLVHAERGRVALERENGASDDVSVEDSTVTHFPDVDMTLGEWDARVAALEAILA